MAIVTAELREGTQAERCPVHKTLANGVALFDSVSYTGTRYGVELVESAWANTA